MGTSSNDPKAVTRMDEAIGILIRTARKEIKLTQIDLAKKVGLTFQQIQKYEKGINRVSASRLAEIAIALEKPLEYFFNHEDFLIGCIRFSFALLSKPCPFFLC